jgi:hypothetical protein
MRKEVCFKIGQLGYIDEVTLTFHIPTYKTVNVEGAKTIMIRTSGNGKTIYTVVLVCCADDAKLPTFFFFKKKS